MKRISVCFLFLTFQFCSNDETRPLTQEDSSLFNLTHADPETLSPGSCTELECQIFVSVENGDDSNSGTIDAPFKSITHAKEIIRQSKQTNAGRKYIVNIRQGVYSLERAIEFDHLDSGVESKPIVYKAYQATEGSDPEKVIVSGCQKVSDWESFDREKNIFRTTINSAGFRQLYIDDQLAIRARWPNMNDKKTFGPYKKANAKRKNKEFVIDKADWAPLAKIANKQQIEMVGISHWYQQRIRIGSFTVSDRNVHVKAAKPEGKFHKKGNFYKNTRYYFENAKEFIDSPFEWYFDKEESYLYLALPSGETPASFKIEIPNAYALMSLRGSPNNRIHHIKFEGLTFECSNWTSPSDNGLNITQFSQIPPNFEQRIWDNRDYPHGMIRVEHAHNLTFKNNEIRKAGAHGLQFFENVDHSEIVGNSIHTIAANGITIDTPGVRNPNDDQQSLGVKIYNNHISKVGQNYSNGGALLALNVKNFVIDHNHIHDMPYSGIQIGEQPGDIRDVGCGGNLIRFNKIHDVMQLHDDGGGIYTLGGIQKGTKILQNNIYSIEKSEWAGGYGIDYIYLDNYSSKILVQENVLHDGKAKERNGSDGNTISNNYKRNATIEQNSGILPSYQP